MKRVLGIPAFRRLLVTWTLNEVGFSIGTVALALLVYRRTGSAIGATAFFLCAEFAPAFFSPAFVARLDQMPTRLGLALLYGSEGIIFLVLAWLVGRFSVVPVLGLVILDGTLGIAARALARAAWTSITAPIGLIPEANALVNASLSICYMIGPAIGGVVVAAGGTRTALFVNVGIFALMTVTVLTARGLPSAVSDRGPSSARLRAAFRRAWREPLIRKLVSLQAAGTLFFSISVPVEVVFAQHTLRTGAGGYGVLLAAWGAGTIIGSAAYARWRRLSSRLLITLGTLLLGVGFLVMALAPALGVAIAGSAIAGAGNGIQIVAMRTAVQEAVTGESMPLILSLNESMFQALPCAGILLGGGIAAIAGARIAFAVAAAGSLVVALAVWLALSATSESVETNSVEGRLAEPETSNVGGS